MLDRCELSLWNLEFRVLNPHDAKHSAGKHRLLAHAYSEIHDPGAFSVTYPTWRIELSLHMFTGRPMTSG